MNTRIQHLLLGGWLLLAAGCATTDTPQSFTFSADLPPGFAYVATASYVAAPEQNCKLGRHRIYKKYFNRQWQSRYQPTHNIALSQTHKGCVLALHRVELHLYAKYGQGMDDIGTSFAGVAVRNARGGQETNMFNVAGVSQFGGQCQWQFRTVGPQRTLAKILTCKDAGAADDMMMVNPFAAYTLDQLSGKTVRLKIELARQEQPFMMDTWVKVAGGWKRCMGQGTDIKDGYCRGNHKDFSSFRLPDERVCTIYPGCTEPMTMTQ
jgi:hypothetical protein